MGNPYPIKIQAGDAKSAATVVGVATFTDPSNQPGGGSQPGVQIEVVTVSSAEILALFETPVQLVAAPGAGKAIIPVGMPTGNNGLSPTVVYLPGSTPYTDNGGDITIFTGPLSQISTTYWGYQAGAGFWDQSVSEILALFAGSIQSSSGSVAATILANQPLMLGLSGGPDPTLGNGHLVVTIPYFVASLA